MTTWIQGIGEVEGIPAETLQPGDKTLWNGPTVCTVAALLSSTLLTVTLQITDDESGRKYSRRFKRNTIVAIA